MEQRNLETYVDELVHSTGVKSDEIATKLDGVHTRLRVPPTAVNDAGQTFIHIAIATGVWNGVHTMPIVKFYLEKGVDINAQDERGRTALHYAAMNGSLYLTQELLKLGANPALKTRSGKTALRDAIDNRRDAVAQLLTSKKGKAVTPQWMGDPSRTAKDVVPTTFIGSRAHPLPETTYTLADPSKPPEPIEPRILGPSAIFPKLTGVGRKTRKHGHTRVRRRARGRLSRRKVKA